MTATAVITGCLDVLMALSPTERFSAMRQFNVNTSTEKIVMIICIATILVLTIVFFTITLKKNEKGKLLSEKLFTDYAQSSGLSELQMHLLSELARYSGLNKKELLFTSSDAFENGLRAITTSHWFMVKDRQEKQNLLEELTVLRNKIGFESESEFLSNSNKVNIKQLPIGHKLDISYSKAGNGSVFSAKIVKNEGDILTIKTQSAISVFSGQVWYGRFDFAGNIWEFDFTVVSNYGDIIVLSHDNKVRFASKRQFRVIETDYPGLVAKFPFLLKLSDETKSEIDIKTPDFFNIRVEKITGPFIEIKTSTKLVEGERVLLIIQLAEQQKAVQGLAVAKNVKINDGVVSAILELLISSDSQMRELVQIANLVGASCEKANLHVQGEFNFDELNNQKNGLEIEQESYDA